MLVGSNNALRADSEGGKIYRSKDVGVKRCMGQKMDYCQPRQDLV